MEFALASITACQGSPQRKKKKVPLHNFSKKARRHTMRWRWAVGDWQLVAVGGWGLVVDGGWQLAVGRRWRLAAVGSWRLVVGG